VTHKRPQESPWKIISSLDATVADWVGPSFYLQGPHLQRLGFSVPLYGELEEEIGKRAFQDVIGRICMSPTLKVHENSVETLTMVGLALFAVGARDSPSIADRQRAREQGRC